MICRYNLPDTVVWNPWDSKAKEMEDFGDDEVFPYFLLTIQRNFLLKQKLLSVPKHDLRERGASVYPGDPACRAGL